MNERRMAAQQRSNRRSSRRSSYSPPRGGGADMGTVSTPTRKANPVLVARAEAEQRQADETNRRIAASPSRVGVPTLKEKIISGGRTLAELKNARDILMGNWLGVGKNVLGTIGARKLLGDQAYRGGDIQSWDEDDVSGIGSFNFADMGITTPNTDYTQLAKVTDDQKAIIKRDIGLVPDLFSIQDVYDKAKKLDDTGAFWNPLDKGDPMTKPEFNEYIKTLPGREEKGPFINLKADGGLINFFKNGGFLG